MPAHKETNEKGLTDLELGNVLPSPPPPGPPFPAFPPAPGIILAVRLKDQTRKASSSSVGRLEITLDISNWLLYSTGTYLEGSIMCVQFVN